MTRKEKINNLLADLRRVIPGNIRQIEALLSAEAELAYLGEPCLPYVHNMLARAWVLPMLKPNDR